MKIKSIGNTRLNRPLLCLLDTGSTGTLIQRRALPFGCTTRFLAVEQIMTTANGSFETLESVSLNLIKLPEFVNGSIVDRINDARLFDSPNTKYDIIFGRDFLLKCKMQFCFHTHSVEWLGAKITMKPANYFNTMFNGIANIQDCGTQPGDG